MVGAVLSENGDPDGSCNLRPFLSVPRSIVRFVAYEATDSTVAIEHRSRIADTMLPHWPIQHVGTGEIEGRVTLALNSGCQSI